MSYRVYKIYRFEVIASSAVAHCACLDQAYDMAVGVGEERNQRPVRNLLKFH